MCILVEPKQRIKTSSDHLASSSASGLADDSGPMALLTETIKLPLAVVDVVFFFVDCIFEMR